MAQLDKNTVSAENQLKYGNYITFFGDEGPKIIFAGNSITRHGVKEDIGWFGDWGMAASSIDKDYVHILMKMVSEKIKARFCVAQVSRWEMQYNTGENVFEDFTPARDFDADIIITRFVENCPHNDSYDEFFYKKFEEFINYLNKSGKSKIIITTGFWHHPADEQLRIYAKNNNLPLVELGDLGELDEMKAIGLFDHGGVANHPGDKGMEVIADRIWEVLEKMI